MPISLTCPHCGKKLAVPDGHAGKKGRCPQCKNIIEIPAAQEDDTIPLVSEAAEEENTVPVSPPPGQADTGGTLGDKPLVIEGEVDHSYGVEQRESVEVPDKCPECGSDIPPGGIICVNCGLNLVTGMKIGGDQKKKLQIPKQALIGVGLVILIGVVVYFFILPQFKKSGAPRSERSMAMQGGAGAGMMQPSAGAAPSTAAAGQQPAGEQTAAKPSTSAPGQQVPAGMVLVPAGPFLMGSNKGDPSERPQHPVDLPAFYIDIHEVTNAEYKKFVDATGHAPPTNPQNPKLNIWKGNEFPKELANHPVVNVSLDDAKAYAAWAGKRLPTEAEWEKAARGTDGRIYPWGNKFAENMCNVASKKTKPVGSFPNGKSPYGCLDMAGNVWEWTTSKFEPYPGSQFIPPAPAKDKPVIRGGSFIYDKTFARCSARTPAFRGTQGSIEIGFRCVRDALATTKGSGPVKQFAELAQTPEDEFAAQWLTTGKTVYSLGKEGAFKPPVLRRIQLGGPQKVIPQNFRTITGFSVSPDTTKIALAASKKVGTTHIWIMNADGSNVTQLTRWDARDASPAWSPDGQNIAFASSKNGTWDIWLVPASGGDPEVLISSAAAEQSPAWSPDGKKLAFVSDREGVAQICIFDLDAGTDRTLTRSATDLDHPAWSPDGKTIAADTLRDGVPRVVLFAASDGTETLLQFEGAAAAPFWSPGAKQLGFIGTYQKHVNLWCAVFGQ